MNPTGGPRRFRCDWRDLLSVGRGPRLARSLLCQSKAASLCAYCPGRRGLVCKARRCKYMQSECTNIETVLLRRSAFLSFRSRLENRMLTLMAAVAIRESPDMRQPEGVPVASAPPGPGSFDSSSRLRKANSPLLPLSQMRSRFVGRSPESAWCGRRHVILPGGHNLSKARSRLPVEIWASQGVSVASTVRFGPPRARTALLMGFGFADRRKRGKKVRKSVVDLTRVRRWKMHRLSSQSTSVSLRWSTIAPTLCSTVVGWSAYFVFRESSVWKILVRCSWRRELARVYLNRSLLACRPSTNHVVVSLWL